MAPTDILMTKPRIHLSIAHPTGKEEQFISEALKSNWITTQGPQVVQFEKELKAYLGIDNPIVLVNSGTAAIHLGLIELGVQPGDDVICQDLTFVASVNPVQYLGANPIFVDSEKDTWNISPEFLETAIVERIKKTGKTPKAIVPVNLYGMPALWPEILQIAEKYSIPVLEDAAEALGSHILINGEKKFCSTLGYTGVISFNGNKVITTAGGGALVCPNEEFAQHIRHIASQARDKVPFYQHSELGYNYNLSNISAALGIAQIENLQKYVDRRRKIHFLYRSELSVVPGIEFQNEREGTFSNYWLTCILFESYETREAVRKYLEAKNIESRPLWNPMHLQPFYKDYAFFGTNVGESLFQRGLCLPSGSILDDEDVLRVCSLIKKCLNII